MIDKIKIYIKIADAAIKYSKSVSDLKLAKARYIWDARMFIDDLPQNERSKGRLSGNEDFKQATSVTYSEFIKKRSASNRAKHNLFKIVNSINGK